MLLEDGEEDLQGDHGEVLASLERMAASSSFGSLEECYGVVVEDSLRLVSEHWTEVEAVARALRQTGTLDGPQVVRIIELAGGEEA